jgi:hypothetical protein
MNDLHRAAATAVLAAAGPWGGHSNGNIPLSALTTLSWAPGHRLRSDAAAAFESLNQAYRARFGTSISITDSYRTLAAQQHLYETKGPGLAAVPGTSNHGWALAVDLGGGINSFGTAQHVWMVANGPAYGWIHPTWARQGGGREEAWHFEYDGSTTPAPPTTPTTPSLEDDMPFRIHVTSSPNTPSEVGKIYLAQFGPTGQCLFQHINPEENGVHDLVKTPIYNVSHYQKDLIRKNIITREAAWKVV